MEIFLFFTISNSMGESGRESEKYREAEGIDQEGARERRPFSSGAGSDGRARGMARSAGRRKAGEEGEVVSSKGLRRKCPRARRQQSETVETGQTDRGNQVFPTHRAPVIS